MNVNKEKSRESIATQKPNNTTVLSEIKRRHVDQVAKPPGSINSILLNKGNSSILSHLLGRETTKHDIRSLLSLGTCSIDTYIIVLDYIQRLTCSYINNIISFSQTCLKTQDLNDGMKILMIKSLKDNDAYLMEVEFTKYLNDTNLNDAAIRVRINNTIQALGKVLKTMETNTLIDGILCNLYDTISASDAHSTWEKKTRALSIIRALADSRFFGYYDPILIEIVYATERLLGHNQWHVSNNAIWVMASLTQAGVLAKAEVAVIESFLMQAATLMDYKQAISMIKQLANTNVLQRVRIEVIEHILVHLEQILNHKELLVQQTGLWAIKVLAQIGVLTGVKADIIQSILIKAEALLKHKQWRIVHGAIATINALAKAGLLKRISIEVIECMLLHGKEIFDNQPMKGSRNAILTISTLAQAGLLKGSELKAIEFMLLHPETLFDHKDHVQGAEMAVHILERLLIPAETELPQKTELDVLERILIQILQLLTHKEKDRLATAMLTIIVLAATDLLNKITPSLIDDIITQVRSLLNHDHEEVLGLAKQTIDQLTQTSLLKEI